MNTHDPVETYFECISHCYLDDEEEEVIIEDTSETKLDSIYFQVSHLEGIKCSHIKIALDREKEDVVNNFDYVIENNQLGIKVDTEKSFSVLINVSNICIQEFGESCPDEY